MQLKVEQQTDGRRYYRLEADHDFVGSRILVMLLHQLAGRPYVASISNIFWRRLADGNYVVSFAIQPKAGNNCQLVDKQILHRLRTFFRAPGIELVVTSLLQSH